MNVIITLPAMGKTTLVKKGRDNAWRQAMGVDIDMRGLNSYTDGDRRAITDMINGWSANGRYKFCTTFNGSIDFSRLATNINVYFVIPSQDALSYAIARSVLRGDSSTFTGFYSDHREEWALGLAYQFIKASCIRRRKHSTVYCVILRGNRVLTDYFDTDGKFKTEHNSDRFSLTLDTIQKCLAWYPKNNPTSLASTWFYNLRAESSITPHDAMFNILAASLDEEDEFDTYSDETLEFVDFILRHNLSRNYGLLLKEHYIYKSYNAKSRLVYSQKDFVASVTEALSDNFVIDEISDHVVTMWKCEYDTHNPMVRLVIAYV